MNKNNSPGHECLTADSPLVISMPHCGTTIPAELSLNMMPVATEVHDTDWFVDKLYAFAEHKNISIIKAKYSRYIIDINRSKLNETLYPGQFTTTLCPTTTFRDEPLYLEGFEPTKHDQEDRIRQIWQPYHDDLMRLIEQAKKNYGYAILLDAHSISSQVPLLFEGKLTDLNYGFNNGTSCDSSLIKDIKALPHTPYSLVCDGRFRGGYICRHYGRPDLAQHAIQLELSQATYLDESSLVWQQDRAERLQQYLETLVDLLLGWQPDKSGSN